MYILDFLGIGKAVENAGRTIVFSIFSALLRAIVKLYNLFMQVANLGLIIISDETIRALYNRIGLILGLFMVFRLTFSAIEYLVNPDSMLDRQKGLGNVIKKVLIVVILLGSVNFLFETAYKFQGFILDNEDDVLAKVILGTRTTGDGNPGINLAWQTFETFFLPNEKYGGAQGGCFHEQDGELKLSSELSDELRENNGDIGSFDKAKFCLNSSINDDGRIYAINFDWLFGILTAGFIAYILLVYTIQVGIRAIQLAYLRMIAPIPIMMYLNPKGDETLKKWGQQCLTTYIDVFIRIAIMYFIILIIGEISNANIPDNWIKIIFIIALLAFTKRIPNLIKEIFPSSGSAAGLGFGFKIPEEAKKVGLFGAGAILGGAGALTSNAIHGVSNINNAWKKNQGKGTWNQIKATGAALGMTGLSMVAGATSGITRGARIKNMRGVGETVKTTNQNRDKREARRAAGYDPLHAFGDSVLGFAGEKTYAAKKIEEAEGIKKANEIKRNTMWSRPENLVRTNQLNPEIYAKARNMQREQDKAGNISWKYYDENGLAQYMSDEALTKEFTVEYVVRDQNGEVQNDKDGNIKKETMDLSSMIRENADLNDSNKKQDKNIKAYQEANNDAKK